MYLSLLKMKALFCCRYICQTLGLDDAGARKKQIPHDRSHDDGLYHLEGEKLLPYVVHALVLTVFGWFCIHVQVNFL